MKPFKRGPVYALLGPHQHALAKKISVLSKPQIHAHEKRNSRTYLQCNNVLRGLNILLNY